MSAGRNFKVANAAESKARVLAVLNGETGAAADIVALNAGAALYVAGVASSIEGGLARARAAIASGAARRKLDDYLAATRRHGQQN
jgi:anthranilate phosphoribosyltransferase